MVQMIRSLLVFWVVSGSTILWADVVVEEAGLLTRGKYVGKSAPSTIRNYVGTYFLTDGRRDENNYEVGTWVVIRTFKPDFRNRAFPDYQERMALTIQIDDEEIFVPAEVGKGYEIFQKQDGKSTLHAFGVNLTRNLPQLVELDFKTENQEMKIEAVRTHRTFKMQMDPSFRPHDFAVTAAEAMHIPGTENLDSAMVTIHTALLQGEILGTYEARVHGAKDYVATEFSIGIRRDAQDPAQFTLVVADRIRATEIFGANLKMAMSTDGSRRIFGVGVKKSWYDFKRTELLGSPFELITPVFFSMRIRGETMDEISISSVSRPDWEQTLNTGELNSISFNSGYLKTEYQGCRRIGN